MANSAPKSQKPVLPIYGAAATWVIYAVFFDLYKASHFVFAALLSLGVYMLLQSVCPEQTAETVAPAAPPKEEKTTNNPELDKMIRDGQAAISEMKRLNNSIADEKISANIRQLESVCQRIFDQIKADPSKLPQIHKFMDYYLPTTLKLLNAYDRMADIDGQNTGGTKRRIEDVMTTIVAAFEKQLDALFGSDALDISTDIAVLETMLAREGLAGEKMEAGTASTDIRLDL